MQTDQPHNARTHSLRSEWLSPTVCTSSAGNMVISQAAGGDDSNSAAENSEAKLQIPPTPYTSCAPAVPCTSAYEKWVAKILAVSSTHLYKRHCWQPRSLLREYLYIFHQMMVASKKKMLHKYKKCDKQKLYGFVLNTA